MIYDIYFDESGDLGWTLNLPYRKGGSSRFFLIAYLIIPKEKNKLIERFINKFHKERKGIKKEIKGASFRNSRAKVMSRLIIDFIRQNSDITIGYVVIKKSNVPITLVASGNDDVMYNYMVKIGITNKIGHFASVDIIPDKKSVPAGSKNSCPDLIKENLWLSRNSLVEITYKPEESHHNSRLIFIDWIANFIWRHYEDKNSEAFQILEPVLGSEQLFF
ncbi:MAG: hypothetical protein ACI85O_002222 [Saprospiraceae bacterium]|jgi:hypothetical protein